jgi:AbrB family looped-hinge helix DNA binding protein
MAVVKIGVSRQVVIPKKIHDTLGLAPGDYLEVAVKRGKAVMTPKAFVDKRIEKRLAKSFEDFRKGRTYGLFSSAKEAIEALDAPKKRKKAKAS